MAQRTYRFEIVTRFNQVIVPPANYEEYFPGKELAKTEYFTITEIVIPERFFNAIESYFSKEIDTRNIVTYYFNHHAAPAPDQ